jgi:hypothetical protein
VKRGCKCRHAQSKEGNMPKSKMKKASAKSGTSKQVGNKKFMAAKLGQLGGGGK